MNKNIKYIIYFFIGIIIYYLLFNDNRLVEGWECKKYMTAECNLLNTGECKEWADLGGRCSCVDTDKTGSSKGKDAEGTNGMQTFDNIPGICDRFATAAYRGISPGTTNFKDPLPDGVPFPQENPNWENEVFNGCLRQRSCKIECTGDNEETVIGRTRWSGRDGENTGVGAHREYLLSDDQTVQQNNMALQDSGVYSDDPSGETLRCVCAPGYERDVGYAGPNMDVVTGGCVKKKCPENHWLKYTGSHASVNGRNANCEACPEGEFTSSSPDTMGAFRLGHPESWNGDIGNDAAGNSTGNNCKERVLTPSTICLDENQMPITCKTRALSADVAVVVPCTGEECVHDPSKCSDSRKACCSKWHHEMTCSDGFIATPDPCKEAGTCGETCEGAKTPETSDCGTFHEGVGCFVCYPQGEPAASNTGQTCGNMGTICRAGKFAREQNTPCSNCVNDGDECCSPCTVVLNSGTAPTCSSDTNSQVTSCNPTFYLNNDGSASVCNSCTECDVDQHQKVACGVSNTVCESCAEGSCTACTTCPAGQEQQSDVECLTVTSEKCKPCVTGKYSTADDNDSCVPWTTATEEECQNTSTGTDSRHGDGTGYIWTAGSTTNDSTCTPPVLEPVTGPGDQTYNWTMTPCATECGLSKTTQSRIFTCKNSVGAVVDAALCTDVKPNETQVCEATTACELDDKVYCDKYTLCPTGTLKAAAATIEGATNDSCCDAAPASLTCATFTNCSGTLSELKEYASGISCSGTECTKEECCEEDDTVMIVGILIFCCCCCIITIIVLWLSFKESKKAE